MRLARGRAAYSKAAFKGAAGQVLSVDVRLNRAALKALAGSGTLNATLRASGADKRRHGGQRRRHGRVVIESGKSYRPLS